MFPDLSRCVILDALNNKGCVVVKRDACIMNNINGRRELESTLSHPIILVNAVDNLNVCFATPVPSRSAINRYDIHNQRLHKY